MRFLSSSSLHQFSSLISLPLAALHPLHLFSTCRPHLCPSLSSPVSVLFSTFVIRLPLIPLVHHLFSFPSHLTLNGDIKGRQAYFFFFFFLRALALVQTHLKVGLSHFSHRRTRINNNPARKTRFQEVRTSCSERRTDEI